MLLTLKLCRGHYNSEVSERFKRREYFFLGGGLSEVRKRRDNRLGGILFLTCIIVINNFVSSHPAYMFCKEISFQTIVQSFKPFSFYGPIRWEWSHISHESCVQARASGPQGCLAKERCRDIIIWQDSIFFYMFFVIIKILMGRAHSQMAILLRRKAKSCIHV